MAIAAIVLHSTESLQELENALRALPGTVDAKQVPPGKLAATIESPAETLIRSLEKAENLPGVWNLELVYVNYEEDLDCSGFMNSPPAHLLRKRKK